MLETLKEALNQINASETAAEQLKDLTALNQLLVQKIEEDESNLNQVNSKFSTNYHNMVNSEQLPRNLGLKRITSFVMTFLISHQKWPFSSLNQELKKLNRNSA